MSKIPKYTSDFNPKGFKSYVSNLGIKNTHDDFVCISSETPCIVEALFTQSRFAGPSVRISQNNLAHGDIRALVTLSKNANIATGPDGFRDAQDIIKICANELGIRENQILIASTGVIGRRYPMDRIRQKLSGFGMEMTGSEFERAAKAIMTTDTIPKLAFERIEGACLVGIAKGSGMIEPNMATLLTYFFTDAKVEYKSLTEIFRRVVEKTFNCLSIDTDTSTSDTAAIFANGMAGSVAEDKMELALTNVAMKLVKLLAMDGEGATTLIEVKVENALNYKQAKGVAKSIVNSPLVKTAIHGKDPNWGRVAMAIGKCEEYSDILPEKIVIRFGDLEVYPAKLDKSGLLALQQIMEHDEVLIHINLNIGNTSATVWGCDLSSEYIHINSDYTT